jgi:hypothetical protein
MQDKPAEAEAALKTAWDKGWRSTWRARADPFLGQLTLPGK